MGALVNVYVSQRMDVTKINSCKGDSNLKDWYYSIWRGFKLIFSWDSNTQLTSSLGFNYGSYLHQWGQKILTYFVKGSITVKLTFFFTYLDSAALLVFNQQLICLIGRIQQVDTFLCPEFGIHFYWQSHHKMSTYYANATCHVGIEQGGSMFLGLLLNDLGDDLGWMGGVNADHVLIHFLFILVFFKQTLLHCYNKFMWKTSNGTGNGTNDLQYYPLTTRPGLPPNYSFTFCVMSSVTRFERFWQQIFLQKQPKYLATFWPISKSNTF